METIKVRVENGKIVGPAPRGMPEGTELELRIADPGDAMTEDEIAAVNEALAAAWRSVKAGRFRNEEPNGG